MWNGKLRTQNSELRTQNSELKTMLYLSQLLGRPLRDRHGNQVARIQDLVVRLPAPVAEAELAARYQAYPTLHGLVARGGKRAAGFFVPRASLATLGPEGGQLATPDVFLETFERRPGELLLAADLLDHPVIDCPRAVVHRTNDVLVGARAELGSLPQGAAPEASIIYQAADLVLLGVDVGWTGLLRRLGLLTATTSLLRAQGRRLAPAILPWPDLALTGPEH